MFASRLTLFRTGRAFASAHRGGSGVASTLHGHVWQRALLAKRDLATTVEEAPPSGVKIRRRTAPKDSEFPAEVRTALDVAVHGGPLVAGSDRPLDVRLAALRSLGELLSDDSKPDAASSREPLAAAAENALHEVMTRVVGDSAPVLREAAAEALWNSWHRSGNKEAEAAMRRGLALMEKQHLREAVGAFSEVIDIAPDFVEGWNKRATASFMLKDFEKSIEDCLRALEIKPRHFGALAGLGMCYQGRRDEKAAIKWFKEALSVHPGLDGPRRVINLLEVQSVVNQRLRPCVVKVVQALNDGTSAALPTSVSGATCDWELYKVRPAADAVDDGSNTYFLRVRIEADATQSDGGKAVSATFKSLARFYVLRFSGGRIFPLTRLTDGKAGVEIPPGEQHRFAWQLAVSGELIDAAGGVLLERRYHDDGGASSGIESAQQQTYVECGLPTVTPLDASADEVERMRLGYDYTGQLDLRRLSLTPDPDSKPSPERAASEASGATNAE